MTDNDRLIEAAEFINSLRNKLIYREKLSHTFMLERGDDIMAAKASGAYMATVDTLERINRWVRG